MPTLTEILLKRMAALAGVLTLVGLLVGELDLLGRWPTWPALATVYLTGVSYGFGEMTRLYHRHRRRCRQCLEGAGPHARWWVARAVLVLVVSVLPVLLLLPVVTRS
jgi:hypothetical protein